MEIYVLTTLLSLYFSYFSATIISPMTSFLKILTTCYLCSGIRACWYSARIETSSKL